MAVSIFISGLPCGDSVRYKVVAFRSAFSASFWDTDKGLRHAAQGGVLWLQLENNEGWRVAVLAPTHFARRLMFYAV